MANEDLGLKLTAEVSKYVAGLAKAAAESEKLAEIVLKVERQVVASLMRMEAAARVSLGKTTAAFIGAEAKIGEASADIEADAKGVGLAMVSMGKDAEKGAQRLGTAAGKMKTSAGGIGDAIAAGASSGGRPLDELGSRFDALGERVRGTVLNIQTALLGLGAVRFGQAAVGAASEFEAALGQLKIVAADSGRSIEQFRGDLESLAKTTPVGLVDLTKALGTAVGTLPKGADQARVAFEALTAAQSAARASGATAEEVLVGLTAVLNTYGKTGVTANQITDKLFATFDQGGATVPQLTSSIGQVAGIASQFGISLDEVLGSIAVLTRGGQTASEAITNLRQAFISTARPPENVRKELEKLGLSADLFSAQSLKTNGLIGVLEQLQAKGGASQVEKLYTDVQGFLGVSTLLGAGLGQVRDDIDRIGQSAGKTDAAVATISQNFDQLAGIAKNRLSLALIDIGERIMPTVARVLTELADYAEKNGAQIAQGIGEAVDALARFGEFVVSYGPEILTFLAAVKGTQWFVGLANDVAAAGMALRTFSQGLAASDALGKGLASLGAQGGKSFLGGMGDALKGAGGVVSTALRSPGMAAAIAGVFTIGYEIGKTLMEALGDAIEEGTQRQIRGAIDALDAELSGRLKALGARTVEEAADIRRRLTSGQAVQTGAGVRTLGEVKAGGGDVQAAFNAGLEAIAKQVDAAQAANIRNVQAMSAAAAKVEELARRQIGGAELADAETAFAQQQAAVQASAKRVAELTDGSKALVAQYTELTKKSAAETTAAGAAGAAAAKTATSGMRKAAEDTSNELERLAQEVIDLYKREAEALARITAERQRVEVENQRNAVEAKIAAYDQDTDRAVEALRMRDAYEEDVLALESERSKKRISLIDEQIQAIKAEAELRKREAKAAADAEAREFAGSAEIQAQIAAKTAVEIEGIEADSSARINEIRAAADRDNTERAIRAAKARAEAERAVTQVERAQAQFQSPREAGKNIAAEGAAAGGGAGEALGAVGGAVAVLPAINQVAGAGADLFGGDVAGLRAKARAREREAAQAEARIAAGGLSEEEKAALQERADAARAEADAFRKAAEDAKGGLETFFEDLFTNIERFFVGWLDGLPQAIDRIVNELLPAFVEKVIASLPKIIVGFVTLAPRIAFAIIKAIVYSLPIAIYDGAKQAFASVMEALTSDIAQAIIDGVETAFTAAVDLLGDGINAIFSPIIDFFDAIFGGAGDLLDSIDSGIESIPVVGAAYKGVKSVVGGAYDATLGAIFHQGGSVGAGLSDPGSAAILAASGAPRFADGGMVRRLDSLSRRRLSQVLSGDDVPALLAPGEGVLTRQGVAAVGGPNSLDSINRGNAPMMAPGGGGNAIAGQVVLSARIGGDRALAALVSRIVSVSMVTPGGAVRTAIDDANRATSYPGVSWVR